MARQPKEKHEHKRFKGWDPAAEAATYDSAFYEKHRKYYKKGLATLVAWLETNVTFDSIADIGCGCGDMLLPFVGKKKLFGIDFSTGATNMLVIPQDRYLSHDLTTPIPGEVAPVDLLISLEVYEHIPRAFEDVFIANLLKFQPKTLIVSCAEAGQPGLHHYNCRGRDEVVELFKAHGYVFDVQATVSFQSIKHLAAFYKNNTAVLRRQQPAVNAAPPA